MREIEYIPRIVGRFFQTVVSTYQLTYMLSLKPLGGHTKY